MDSPQYQESIFQVALRFSAAMCESMTLKEKEQ
jgi:hypothetical protein